MPWLGIIHAGICGSDSFTAVFNKRASHQDQLQRGEIEVAAHCLVAAVQGVMHSEDGSLESHRVAFIERAHKALNTVLQSVPFDSAADEMSVRFLRQRLPHPDVSQVTILALCEPDLSSVLQPSCLLI